MMMAASEFCAVCICGGIGAVCRFALDGAVRRLWKRSFPLSTFIINALASFIIGIITGIIARPRMYGFLPPAADPAVARMIIATGFLGGFSTFSTAVNETVSLACRKKYGTCIGYFFSMAIAPVLCVALGYFIVK
ncbi:fluoride efflux transporter FluC [Scardovia wiggsiae]|uniref:fluoride efflux transporter FluC n=1 Tax=Scardovia wiggsiae TaxID=230143 RepID=UPI00374FACC9